MKVITIILEKLTEEYIEWKDGAERRISSNSKFEKKLDCVSLTPNA